MVQPLRRVKKVHKHPKRFVRYHAGRFLRLGASWRAQRGIDNKVRRKYRGYDIKPRIGYGTIAKARHVLPNGFKKFTINVRMRWWWQWWWS